MRGNGKIQGKNQRLKNKQKQVKQEESREVVDDDSNVDYVVDTFDLSRPINMMTDICVMCKQGHDFGVLMQRIMPSISDFGISHLDGDDADGMGPALGASDDNEKEKELGGKDSSQARKKQKVAADERKVGNGVKMGMIADNTNSAMESAPLDPDRIWISRFSLSHSNRRIFVHYYCALYSPRTWYTGLKWHNVMKEVSRSGFLACSYCKQRGATIGCYEPRCKVVMHFPCAVKTGHRIYRYAHSFHCPEHSNRVKPHDSRKKLEDAASRMSDVSLGKEPIPVSIDDSTLSSSTKFQGNAYHGPDFTYVNFNVDSDDVISNSRNVDGLACCKCEDLCDDPEQCNCLKQGRNYTYQGMLLNPLAEKQIIECNIKCSCSYRRCTNRVVEKGLTFRLQIFRLSPTQKKNELSDIKYGVRTLDFIPQYAFVCQVNGQFVSNTAIGGGSSSSSSDSSSSSTKDDSPGLIRMDSWDDGKQVDPQFLRDNICLDCTKFGNVGVFIRRRPQGTAPMLIRKLVYNATTRGTFPKLSLFAARNIEANSEILL